MPTPTREQFDAAAKKVMQSAPSGLNRDQFFALIDKELSGDDQNKVTAAKTVGADEPGTWWGGALKSLGNSLSSSVTDNEAVQGAAHPQSLGDLMSVLGAPTDATRGSLPIVADALGQAADKSRSGLSKLVRMAGDGNYRKQAFGAVADAIAPKGPQTLSQELEAAARNAKPAPKLGDVPDAPLNVPKWEPPPSDVKPSWSANPPAQPVYKWEPPPQFPVKPAQSNVALKADDLESMLREALISEKPSVGGELPPPQAITDGGNNPMMGRAKKGAGPRVNYTSGRPATPAWEGPVENLESGAPPAVGAGGSGEAPPVIPESPAPQAVEGPAMPSASDNVRSIEPTGDWHSGAPSGSPAAQSAQSMHASEGANNASFQHVLAGTPELDQTVLAQLLQELGQRGQP